MSLNEGGIMLVEQHEVLLVWKSYLFCTKFIENSYKFENLNWKFPDTIHTHTRYKESTELISVQSFMKTSIAANFQ